MLQTTAHIEQFSRELAELQPLSTDNAQKLAKKFRLEWNYNSNHIEGNTLTYGETELLLIFGETKGNHEIREYDEMQGHDVALTMVQELAKDGERILTEQFIRQLNEVILKKTFYKEAITQDGQPTRRLITVGSYKTTPNSVRLQNGEMFHYTSPAETPAAMHDLMQWYQAAAGNEALHPVEVAAELHYRFVLIHPFDDGNGRISRLLMNYHLLKNGHPPVIIKSADKKNYLRALHEADTGNLPAFVEYIAEQLLWSYDISIKAAKGENIDEPGDWEKKLTLLKKHTPEVRIIKKRKKELNVNDALNGIALPIIEFLLTELNPIRSLFFETTLAIHYKGFSTKHNCDFDCIKTFFNNAIEINNNLIDFAFIAVEYKLTGFKNNGTNAFDIVYNASITFNEYSYTFKLKPDDFAIERYYHQSITEEDKDLIATIITSDIIQKVEGA